MDWTDFDTDNQATIMLSLVSRHGRSTPLVWLTVDKATLRNHRNAYEYRVLVQLAEALPANVKVLIVADRGFGDQKLYRVLTEELKFDYLIRALNAYQGGVYQALHEAGICGMHFHDQRNAVDAGDCRRIANEIEAELVE
jgi:hypothetical protein